MDERWREKAAERDGVGGESWVVFDKYAVKKVIISVIRE